MKRSIRAELHVQKLPRLTNASGSDSDESLKDPFECDGDDQSKDPNFEPGSSSSSFAPDVEIDAISIETTTVTSNACCFPTPLNLQQPKSSTSSTTLGFDTPSNSKHINTYYNINKDAAGNRNDKIAICRLCNKNIKMKNSNNSGLKRHLKARHTKEYDDIFPQVNTNQHSIEDIFGIMSNKGFPETNLETKILEWCAIKYLPFNFFNDDKTQGFFKLLNKNVTFPKRTAMREKMLKYYHSLKKVVIKILNENTSKISFTVDSWTSVANMSYYGITAHYIDESWTLQSLALDFVPSRGKHTGKDIADIFCKTLENFQLKKEILQGITMDNAAANTSFMSELKLCYQRDFISFDEVDCHFRCFAHILNLAVQDILKLLGSSEAQTEVDTFLDEYEVEDSLHLHSEDVIDNKIPADTIVNKLRKLFIKIKRSEQWKNKLSSCCDAVNIKQLSTICDVSTRWNSTFSMITTAIKLKPALNALCQNNKDLQILLIDENEWDILKGICMYLKHVKNLSDLLSGEKYVTLPMVIIGFNMVLDKIEEFIRKLDVKVDRNSTDETILLAFQAGRDKLVKHYRKTNWIYGVVLILDPRHKLYTFSLTSWGRDLEQESFKKFEEIFKSQYFLSENNVNLNLADSQCQNELTKTYTNDTNTNEDNLNIHDLFEMEKEIVYHSDWKAEIDDYLNQKRENGNIDVLKWWKDNQFRYPNLARMARDFLSIPATSVPAERLFSKAGLIIRKHRNRLNAESAQLLLCLNSWLTCSLADKIENFNTQT